MSIFRDAELIPLVIKPLQKLFAKYLEIDQEKALKRQMKIEDEIMAKKLKIEAEERQKKTNGNEEQKQIDSLASS